MRCVIAGSRTIDGERGYEIVKKAVADSKFEVSEVVSGRAKGVDLLGEQWALENKTAIRFFPADWKLYGRKAGWIRNKRMAEYIKEGNGGVICIWDGISKGTKNMIDIAKKMELNLFVVNVDSKTHAISE